MGLFNSAHLWGSVISACFEGSVSSLSLCLKMWDQIPLCCRSEALYAKFAPTFDIHNELNYQNALLLLVSCQ